MKRESVFDLPHKGLRIALAELCAAATGNDFSLPQERAAFENLFASVWELIAAHSETEERVTFTELDARLPGASHALRAEHDQLDAAYAELRGAVARGEHCSETEKFCRDLDRFSAAFAAHMNREEDEIEPLVWQYFSDDEIQSHRRNIMVSDGPEKLLKYFRFVFYALTEKQTQEILARLEAMSPAAAFAEAERLAASAGERRKMRL